MVGQRVERATPRLSRPVAATIGVLAVWAALGVGHLAAGLVSAASSPFLAVGDAVVRLSPAGAHRVREEHVRHDDKLVLLSGMFVVITLIGAGAGLLSRERPNPAVWVLVPRWACSVRRPCTSRRCSPISTSSRPRRRCSRASARSAGCTTSACGRGSPTAAAGGLSRRSVLVGGSAAVGLGALASAGVGATGRARRTGLPRRGHRPARPRDLRGAGRARPGRGGVPAARHADVPDVEQRLLPDRHGAADPHAVGRRLAAARARDGRAGAHAELRRPDRPPARRAPDHDDVRVQPGRRRPHLHGELHRRAAARHPAGGGPRPGRRPAVQPQHGGLLHRHPDVGGDGADSVARCSRSG